MNRNIGFIAFELKKCKITYPKAAERAPAVEPIPIAIPLILIGKTYPMYTKYNPKA